MLDEYVMQARGILKNEGMIMKMKPLYALIAISVLVAPIASTSMNAEIGMVRNHLKI